MMTYLTQKTTLLSQSASLADANLGVPNEISTADGTPKQPNILATSQQLDTFKQFADGFKARVGRKYIDELNETHIRLLIKVCLKDLVKIINLI